MTTAVDSDTLSEDDLLELRSSDCTVCSHVGSDQIDEALRGGATIRGTAELFGLNKSSVARHKINHLKLASLAEDRFDGDVDILAMLQRQAKQLDSLISRSRKTTTAVQLHRELRATLQLIIELGRDDAHVALDGDGVSDGD